MKTWTYRGHVVTQRNFQKGQRWLSSAKFRTNQGDSSVMAFAPIFEGFASEKEAQEATAKFVCAQIDNAGIAHSQRVGINKSAA